MGVIAPAAWGQDTIKVASIYAHSGVAAESNVYSIRGVRDAVREINARGGVLGRTMELVELDNKSSPIGSKVAALQAVEQGVTAIIGADWSSHTLAVARVAQDHQIPMVTNISTHGQITATGNYIFRVCYTDAQQGRAMASFARENLRARTAVMLVDLTSDYAMGLSGEFRKQFERLGGKVLLRLDYTMKTLDASSLVSRTRRADPDVVFIPGYEESAVIIRRLAASRVRAIPLGGDGWGSESFFEKGGSAIVEAYYAAHWSEELKGERTKAFVKKFKKTTAAGLDVQALAYDAVFLLADAMKRAGSADRARVRDALADTAGFPGVTGTISFDARGDPRKEVVIMKIHRGVPSYSRSILAP